ncbi:MAG: NADH-quinone oxidoreductase subunit L [Coriobacteriia bacterium]|nr:NADH-quinone oxidoreductase subunit L [Coriobacteriia bacterium]
MDRGLLLIGVPLAVALLISLGGRRSIRFTRWLALVGPSVAILIGSSHLMRLDAGRTVEPFMHALDARTVSWFGSGSLPIGYTIDALAAVMLVVVGVVAAMVVVFSVGYMAEDRAQARYFALLSLFTAAMSALVVAWGLLELFIAWELVGACSYLLIGFWFTKPEAAKAAVKAFLVTRVGDVGLLLALALLWRETGTLELPGIVAALPELSSGTITTAALLLFVGAAGKSAQFPLHIWLPDAMEGPTPVSALIHAATMVAAGVFLVARTWPVFEASDTALTVVLVVGTLTAFGAATVAVTQTDIKRVLAYSTISQLGFMFAALGAGAWVAAVFHLVTHAAFKSLLFLASGSVIHGSGTQDLRKMGGLGRAMPVTTVAWVAGVVALSGLPPFSGFFSKDGIVDAVFQHAPVAGVILLLASAFTGYYSFRATRLAFAGRFRGVGHPHESPLSMTAPLMVLAVLAAVLGIAQGWFAHVFGGHAGLSLPIALASTLAAAVFALLGWQRSGEESLSRGPREGVLGWLQRASNSGYGVDALAMRGARAVVLSAAWVARRFDRDVIDGAANGFVSFSRELGESFTQLQSGAARLYTVFMGVGALVLVAVGLWLGR